MTLATKFLHEKTTIPCTWKNEKGKVIDLKIKDGFLYALLDFPDVVEKIDAKQIKSSIDIKVELSKILIQ